MLSATLRNWQNLSLSMEVPNEIEPELNFHHRYIVPERCLTMLKIRVRKVKNIGTSRISQMWPDCRFYWWYYRNKELIDWLGCNVYLFVLFFNVQISKMPNMLKYWHLYITEILCFPILCCIVFVRLQNLDLPPHSTKNNSQSGFDISHIPLDLQQSLHILGKISRWCKEPCSNSVFCRKSQ